jgi:hypothetical protein
MLYGCSKKTFYLIIVASLGVSACELVSSSKSGLAIPALNTGYAAGH